MRNGNGSPNVEVNVYGSGASPSRGSPTGPDPVTDPDDADPDGIKALRGSLPGPDPKRALANMSFTMGVSSRLVIQDFDRYMRAAESAPDGSAVATMQRLLRNLRTSAKDLTQDLEALDKMLDAVEKVEATAMAAVRFASAPAATPSPTPPAGVSPAAAMSPAPATTSPTPAAP